MTADPLATGRRAARLPVLREGVTVLLRPGNEVHVGSDPHTALILRLPSTVSGRSVAALLDSLHESRIPAEVFSDLVDAGLTRAEFAAILDRLVSEQKAHAGAPRHPRRALRIRVHGTGVLTQLLTASLADAGFPTVRTARRRVHPDDTRVHPDDAPETPPAAVTAAVPNLVILTDHLVHESWVTDELMRSRTPHLPVRLRDGTGLIGPLVLPGLSSCLECADRHRTDRDAAWPVLAAQLNRVTGHASTAIARATAALAHDQIEQLAAASSAADAAPPHLINRMMHLHGTPPRIESTTWVPHPLCRCTTGTITAGGPLF
ncbi:TOMM precursor leader peptide-binding protein [Gordonia sp. VNQ95]|jgi:bacteriocin biosynthesis cyclodehydratase domain-containing protein|uniref:TOMM precursor leader peptide-binding protein n=1 Tax=Gordonia TaxID=2053 RepID=UPI0032B59452